MKECPVCKESFQDDLNFCDLDGSPLHDGAGAASVGSSSKIWSFLGIGLLLAAVGITAAAIIFFPRGPSASLTTGRPQSGATTSSAGQASSSVPDAGRSQTASGGLPVDSSTGLGTGDLSTSANSASPDQSRLGSRKAALSKNDNSDSSLPNPKSVAVSDDDLTRAARQPADETRPRTSKPLPTAGDPSSVGVAQNDSTGSDPAARSAAAKRRAKAQAQGDDADTGGNKKDDKKKGGFLRVFKKIFGHN